MFSVEGLDEFNRDVIRFAKTIPAEMVTTFQKKVALESLSRLVLKTPVDTGRARGNWQCTIGEPILIPIANMDKGGGQTLAAGAQAMSKLPAFVTVFITNNLPYIERLEHGWSWRQAPLGMLAVTFEELREMFK